MIKKIALTAALVLGTATAAFAEDSSSSFSFNIDPQAGQQVLTSRNVALGSGQVAVGGNEMTWFDRASRVIDGGR